MKLPLQLSVRDMVPSAAIEACVHRRTAKLDTFCNQIIRCRVMVEAPHHHHRKGKSYQVRLALTVPGDELIVRRVSRDLTHEHVYTCVNDAFDDAQRLLRDYAQVRRHEVKRHEPTSIATWDGRTTPRVHSRSHLEG
jgi:ribosome-associated translation inhibitor RaiA